MRRRGAGFFLVPTHPKKADLQPRPGLVAIGVAVPKVFEPVNVGNKGSHQKSCPAVLPYLVAELPGFFGSDMGIYGHSFNTGPSDVANDRRIVYDKRGQKKLAQSLSLDLSKVRI